MQRSTVPVKSVIAGYHIMMAIILSYFFVFLVALTTMLGTAYALLAIGGGGGGGGATTIMPTATIAPPTSISKPSISPTPILYGNPAAISMNIANPPSTYNAYFFYCSGSSCVPTTGSPLLASGIDTTSDPLFSSLLCQSPGQPSCLIAGDYHVLACIAYYAITICGDNIEFRVINPTVSITGITPQSPVQGYPYTATGSVTNPPASFSLALYYCTGAGCTPTQSSTLLVQKGLSSSSFSFSLCSSPGQAACLSSGSYSVLPCIAYSGTSVCGSPYPFSITAVAPPTMTCNGQASSCGTLVYPANVALAATCQKTTSTGICEIFQIGSSASVCSSASSSSCACTSTSASISCSYYAKGQSPGSYSYFSEYTGTGQISSPVSYTINSPT